MVIVSSVSEEVARLKRDELKAVQELGPMEVRFLVDTYYEMQRYRTSSANQERALTATGEPIAILGYMTDQFGRLEKQIKRALNHYTDCHDLGIWCKSQYGIGPVITAGLMAHIDVRRAPTASHVWSFAGYNPNAVWRKGEKRPWNAKLKVIGWHAGQSFMKFAGKEECFYGKVYREAKARYIERNAAGQYAEQAAETLATRRINRETAAYQHLIAGYLPPSQVDARARRKAVKLFLAHFHCVAHWCAYEALPPRPYVFDHLEGHADLIDPPLVDVVLPRLAEALAARQDELRRYRQG